jgi:WD40 repeat protein/tetratricopeptide (TPR) repeat protein
MGVVYKARDLRLKRLVALKCIAADKGLDRFRAEAEVIAQLQHPHIVQIHEIGEHDGKPYLVLEYVAGGSLAQKLGDRPQPVEESIALLETLARAVQHAHAQGIVHRDLKPGNVLLTPDGQPKIADFGLAKRLEESAGATLQGDLLGTPSYMAPEQASGANAEVGPATDLYALGVILYEMMTGRTLFQGLSVPETLLMIRTLDPVPPRRLRPDVPRDLETICLKCLQKEPGQRYASALDLAEDLRRFRAREPIRARPVSIWERGWRWCRRNPGVATLTALSGLLAVALLVGSLVAAGNLERKERDSREQLWRAQLEEAKAIRGSGRVGQRVRALDVLQEAATTLRSLHRPDEVDRLLDLRNEAVAALLPPADLRLHQAWKMPDNDDYHGGLIVNAALTRFAYSDNRGNVTVRRLADEQELTRLPNDGPGSHVYALRFSGDGRFLAVAHHRESKWRLWDVDQRQLIAVWPPGSGISFRPDGRCVALADQRGSVALHDLPSFQEVGRLETGLTPPQLAFDPSGRRLAACGGDPARVRVFDTVTGRPLQDWPALTNGNTSLDWSGNGARLATASGRAPVRVWEAATGQLVSTCLEKQGHISQVTLNDDGRLLATVGWDLRLRLWDADTGKLLLVKTEGARPWLGKDRHGRLWSTDGQGLQARLWETVRGEEVTTLEGRASPLPPVSCLHVSPDSRLLASGHEDGVRLWDLYAGREIAHLPGGVIQDVVFHPGQSALFAVGLSGAHRWPLTLSRDKSSERLQVGPSHYVGLATLPAGPETQRQASLSADGQTLAVADRATFQALTCDLRTGHWRTLVLGRDDALTWGVLSPDGRWFVSCPWSFEARPIVVWDAHTGEKVRQLHEVPLATVAFSADSRWLVAGSTREFRFWEVEAWRESRPSLPREQGGLGAGTVTFTRDSSIAALGISPFAVQLQDFTTGRELARLPAPPNELVSMFCLTPDGSRLVMATDAGKLYQWDLRHLRQALAERQLDWHAPPYPPEAADFPSRTPLRAEVDRSSVRWLHSLHTRDTPRHARLAMSSLQIAFTPWHPDPYHERGHVYREMRAFEKAIDDYTIALHASAGQPQYQSHLYEMRGGCWLELNQLDRFVSDLEKATNLDPNNVAAANGLAWFYLAGPPERRAPEKALPLAEQAAHLSANPQYVNTLGVVYYRLGRYEQALETLWTSYLARKGNGVDAYFIAMCRHRLGNPAKAKEFFARAMDWQQTNWNRMGPSYRRDMEQFQAEAEAVLAQPPGR